jgi:hypothetical protein
VVIGVPTFARELNTFALRPSAAGASGFAARGGGAILWMNVPVEFAVGGWLGAPVHGGDGRRSGRRGRG